MKKQIFLGLSILGVFGQVQPIELTKRIENNKQIVGNLNFYITTFQNTEKQKNEIREIFKQKDVIEFCGISNTDFFLSYDPASVVVICNKTTNKIAGVLLHGSKDTTIGYVYILAIHQDYRKLGLASQLLQYVEKIYKNKKATLLQLTVYSHNQRAQALYKKYGFKS